MLTGRSAATGRQSSFVATPVVEHFAADRYADFLRRLEANDLAVEFAAVEQPGDVLFTADGTVGGGYRLTPWALYQLCRLLCSGLYTTVSVLTTSGPDGWPVAVGLLNQMTRLRFDKAFGGVRLMLDRTAGTVEAVVSQQYRPLSNRRMVEQGAETLGGRDGAAFYEASLFGRWGMVRFRRRDPAFSVAGGAYYVGYHLSNHEGGRAAARVEPLLARGDGRITLLSSVTRGAGVRHVGRQVGDRFAVLLRGALDHRLPVSRVFRGIRKSTTTSLGLGIAEGSDVDEQQADRRYRDLFRAVNHHVSAAAASRILAVCATSPAGSDRVIPAAALTRRELSRRTVYDLLAAAGRVAVECDLGGRERAERFAYRLACGRIRL